MNEREFLRSQLQLEQANLAHSCEILALASRSSGTESPTSSSVRAAMQAALAHIGFALPRAMQRAHVHAQLLSDHVVLGQLSAAERDTLREALAALQTVLGEAPVLPPHQSAHQLGNATAPLDPWCTRLYSLSDWRRAAQIDAEAVFEERRLHEAARAAARTAGLLE